jgi:multiple sugar transport system substrate-binding protein
MWANPGEAERFKKYSADYQTKTGTKVIYQVVSGDYLAKLLTQLSGGSAPDDFYVGDGQMSKLIESNVLEPLDTYLASPDATVKFADTYAGLSKWCKSKDGKIYGIPVDCNPHAFWFNKKVLTAAGVTQDPGAAFDAGAWNQAAMTDLLTKVKAAGKKGATLESNWFDIFSWVTTFGGTAFDERGKAVFDTDPKAKAALEWLIEQVKNGNMTYGGSLPKGQGVDALFYAGQLATRHGRWVPPNLKKLKKTVDYDIAPMPSEDGKTVMPVAVYTAAMSTAQSQIQSYRAAFPPRLRQRRRPEGPPLRRRQRSPIPGRPGRHRHRGQRPATRQVVHRNRQERLRNTAAPRPRPRQGERLRQDCGLNAAARQHRRDDG